MKRILDESREDLLNRIDLLINTLYTYPLDNEIDEKTLKLLNEIYFTLIRASNEIEESSV